MTDMSRASATKRMSQSHVLRYAPYKSKYLAFKCLLVPPHVPAASAAHLSIQVWSCRGERKLIFK